MILDARKTPAQRRYNAPKIIQNRSASSELWRGKEQHVGEILESEEISSFYRRKKASIFKDCRFFHVQVCDWHITVNHTF